MRNFILTIGTIVIAVCVVIGLITGWGAADESATYVSTAVVEIDAPASVEFERNDAEPVNLIFTEKSDKEVMVTAVSWTFYDKDGGFLETGSNLLMPPKAADGESVTVDITYSGSYEGDGYIAIEVSGYDTERGHSITSIPAYVSVELEQKS